MGGLLARIRDQFWGQTLEIVLLGLENAGKTTFCNQLAHGQPMDEPPTIGMDIKVFRHRNCTIRAFDLGGQLKYRDGWARYSHGCNAICFVVDTTAPQRLDTVKHELHRVLEDPRTQEIPLLVLANKIDLGPKVSEMELIKALNLDYTFDRDWLVVPVSAKDGTNVEKAMKFLMERSRRQPQRRSLAQQQQKLRL